MALTRKLEEIVATISNDRRTLLASVSGLSNEQMDYRSADGTWAISDILHHLALSDEANVKLCTMMLKKAEDEGLPTDPTPNDSQLNQLDRFSGVMGNRVQAPDRVRPRSHINAEESLARLAESRRKLRELLDRLTDYDLAKLIWPHPLLGELNLYGWLLMAGKHEGRHTLQIERIKSGVDFPPGQS